MEPVPPTPIAADDAAVLQALLEHGRSIVFTIDDTWRILSINRIPDGLGSAEVIGTSCLDYVPPQYQAVARKAFEQVLRTGRPSRYEIRARGPHDSIACYVTQVLPLRPDGGAARLLLVSDDISAQREAEDTLRAGEARFRALAEASFDVVYRMGPDWTEMHHLDGRTVIPDRRQPERSWLEQSIPPEDRAAVRAAIDEAIRARKPFELEHRVRRADGSLGWTRLRAVPMRDERGAITEWVGTGTDVTERREAQRAVAESEERLRLAMDAAEEGLWDLDLATDACYFSPAYFAMLGYPPEALPRHVSSARQLLHPDDIDAAARGTALLHDPGHFTLRFRMRAATGDYRLIESHGKTVRRDAGGRPMRAVGTHVDITERVRLEQALQQSEARLRALIEGTTDAVFVKDLQGRYLLVNGPSLAGGRSAADTLGRDDRDLMPAESARAIMDLDRQVMAEGRVVTIRETLELQPGEPRTFLTTKGPIRGDDGRIVGLFGIARDITDLLRKEEAQRQALQDSRDLLDLALAAAELGTWETDMASGRSTYDNRYHAMLGYRSGELEPTMQAWLQRIHPDERAFVDNAVAAHVAGETRVFEVEHRLRHKDGHWVWVLARGKVFRDASGRAVHAAGTHQDISDRKRVATEGTALLKKIEALISGLGAGGAAARLPGLQGAAHRAQPRGPGPAGPRLHCGRSGAAAGHLQGDGQHPPPQPDAQARPAQQGRTDPLRARAGHRRRAPGAAWLMQVKVEASSTHLARRIYPFQGILNTSN